MPLLTLVGVGIVVGVVFSIRMCIAQRPYNVVSAFMWVAGCVSVCTYCWQFIWTLCSKITSKCTMYEIFYFVIVLNFCRHVSLGVAATCYWMRVTHAKYRRWNKFVDNIENRFAHTFLWFGKLHENVHSNNTFTYYVVQLSNILLNSICKRTNTYGEPILTH